MTFITRIPSLFKRPTSHLVIMVCRCTRLSVTRDDKHHRHLVIMVCRCTSLSVTRDKNHRHLVIILVCRCTSLSVTRDKHHRHLQIHHCTSLFYKPTPVLTAHSALSLNFLPNQTCLQLKVTLTHTTVFTRVEAKRDASKGPY